MAFRRSGRLNDTVSSRPSCLAVAIVNWSYLLIGLQPFVWLTDGADGPTALRRRLGSPRSLARRLERGAGRGRVENEAHGDRVPEFSVATAVLPLQPSLLDESGLAIQRLGPGVVRPHLQDDLVVAALPGPLDGRIQQRRTDASAAPAGGHHHPQVGNSPVALDAEVADQLGARLGQEDRG